jgi:arginine-tRNA-protein transferase
MSSPEAQKLRILPSSPPELVVFNQDQPCLYLHERVARLPLRLPARRLERFELDRRLAEGDRRQGYVLYRTECPSCSACEPIRLDVNHYQPTRTQKRLLRRGDQALTVHIASPACDRNHVALYNKHKRLRALLDGQPPIDAEGYRNFLVSSCCDSFEIRYYLKEELVGVAITDRAETALSAVYCYYDPEQPQFGLGTYSILKQLELCRRWGLRYLYLGLYIAECRAMRYKATFLPHERLLKGEWVKFERARAK